MSTKRNQSKKNVKNLKHDLYVNVSNQWLDNLINYLTELIRPAINNEDLLTEFFSEKYLKIWVQAFTHLSYNRNYNYESLEYLGDAILKSSLIIYLNNRYKDEHLTKEQLNDIQWYYNAKEYQGQLSRSLGLSDYLLISHNIKIGMKINTDLMESFFGALNMIADDIKFGIGYSICYKMLEYIYQDIDINFDTKPYDTKVDQFFSRFGYRTPIVNFEDKKSKKIVVYNTGIRNFDKILATTTESDEKQLFYNVYHETIDKLIASGYLLKPEKSIVVTDDENYPEDFVPYTTITIDNNQLNLIREYNPKIRDKIIGIGYGDDRKEAEENAYRNAYENLFSHGITRQWAISQKIHADLNRPDIVKYSKKIKEKMKRDKYTYIWFDSSGKTSTPNGTLTQLIGVKDDNSQDILASIYISKDDKRNINVNEYLIQNYLNNVKLDLS